MKVLAIVGLGVALIGARPAAACTPPPPCTPSAFVPGDGAHVPANLPAMVWQPVWTGLPPDLAALSLVATDEPTHPIPLVAVGDWQSGSGFPVSGYPTFAPSITLTPGKQYTLSDATACPYDATWHAPDVTFTVTESAPYPTALGVTTVSAQRDTSINVPTMDCGGEFITAVARDVGLAIADGAKPWRDVLLYSTTVDGKPWIPDPMYGATIDPGASWVGRGVDLVYQECTSFSPPTTTPPAAIHSVMLHATLASTDLAIDALSAPVGLACIGSGSGSGSGSDPVMPAPMPSGGCSTSPSTPGGLAIALLVGLRRRKKVTS